MHHKYHAKAKLEKHQSGINILESMIEASEIIGKDTFTLEELKKIYTNFVEDYGEPMDKPVDDRESWSDMK